MSTLSDFISRRRGAERRQRLNELLNYYIPPNLRPAANFAGSLTPQSSYEGAVLGFEEALTPGASAEQVVGGIGKGLSGTMGVAAPLAVANKIGMPAAQAAQEAFQGFSTGVNYAGNVVKDRLSQPGEMPTLYSNPIPGLTPKPDAPLQPSDFQRVSTRLPIGKGATEDPLTESLVSDTEAFLRNPSAAQNMKMMTETYPGMRGLLSDDPVETSENIVEHMSDNIISLYDLADEAGITESSSKWYDGASRIADELAGRFNSTKEKAAGVLAVLSPQKDWYMNVALGERLMKHMDELSPNSQWSDEMDVVSQTKAADKNGETAWTRSDLYDEIRGAPWGEMDTDLKKAMWLRAYDEAHFGNAFREVSPEGDILDYVRKKDGTPSTLVHQSFGNIAKAIRIMEGDGKLSSISGELGSEHKVRNFFNNILTPESPFDVTADTHQIAGGLLMPYGSSAPEVGHGLAGESAPKSGMPWSTTGGKDSGTGGAYGLHFDATKRAAEKIEGNWLPRQMQSITWEQLRALMPSTLRGKSPFVNVARTIWRMKDEGQITGEEARNLIITEARKFGGGAKPSWVDYSGPRRSIAKGAGATAGLLGVTGAGLASAQTNRDK